MADNHQQTKRFYNRLKGVFRLGSSSAVTKYTHLRILVIGRANAGKTTLLKRVCNTTEDPCIYDENNIELLKPTSEGEHNVRCTSIFKSNPQFIFHDVPGFEAGSGREEELRDVMSFIEERSKANKVEDKIHAIWFCFEPNISRPLLDLEKTFFNKQRTWHVPVVAIFMKFDDLIVQVYQRGKGREENNKIALDTLEERFEKPLKACKFPPQAFVRFESIHKDESNHQEQVAELINKTAKSIDDHDKEHSDLQ